MKPFVPPEVDLKEFAFLPLEVLRLRDSDLALKSTGDEFRAAVILWCVAWHQSPAASLPDDDHALASYAGYGRDVKSWVEVREGALRGFVKCADGRLYHATLAEKALDAWEGRLKLRHRKECERLKKAAQRAQVQPAYPSFDEWKEGLAATGSDRWNVPELSSGTVQGQDEDVPGDSHHLKEEGIEDSDKEKDKGEFEPTFVGKESTRPARARDVGAPSPPHPPPAFETLREVLPPHGHDPSTAGLICRSLKHLGIWKCNPSHPEFLLLIQAGATLAEFEDTATEAVLQDKADFRYVIAMVRGRRESAARQPHLPVIPGAAIRAGPNANSKAMQALQKLERMKNESASPMVPKSDCRRLSAACVPGA